jgi:hypothetical protein
MNQLIETVRQGDSTIVKTLFIIACGVLFVFAVQAVFYVAIKLWPKGKKQD